MNYFPHAIQMLQLFMSIEQTAIGNCQIDGNIAEDVEIAHAAKFVIITTEEIVHDEVIEKDPAQTKIPYFTVDAVVEVPYGSHPNQVPGLYSL